MELFLQLCVSGVAAGSIYALIAMGYGLIYGTTGEFHVAHGGVFTFSGYIGYLAYEKWGMGLFGAVIAAVFFAVLAGMLIQTVLYETMRKRQASHLSIFIASLGLLIVLENLSSIIFGYSPLQFSDQALKNPVTIGSISFTPLQLIIVLFSILTVLIVLIFLKFSRTGKAIRGVADSKDMAKIVGMNPAKINMIVYGLGSAIAAPAAVFLSFDAGATPYRGTLLVLLAAIAMIIGGIGSAGGAAFAGLLLGLCQNLSVLFVSSQWSNVVTFSIFLLIIFLIPTGFFGTKVRKKI